MRIALAQIETTVGAFEENADKIREATAEARSLSADVVVFPELTTCGYDARDLLRMPSFLEESEKTLAALVPEGDWNRNIALAVGFAERNRGNRGAPAHNSCAFIQGGAVQAVARKNLLPSYDVLEEARHFEPGEDVTVVQYRGLGLGLCICEDAWSGSLPEGRRHAGDPVRELARAGADVVLNLSASPFHVGKPAFRRRLFSSVAADHGVQVVMVNAVGGNDGTVFDGNSVAFAADGRPAIRCAGFTEDLRVLDTASAGDTQEDGYGPDADLDDVIAALSMGVRDYFLKTGFSRAVLGLSGGMDSAMSAALAARALGPENVLGVAMPSRYSSGESLADAAVLAENLGIELRQISIEKPFSALLEDLSPHLGTGETLAPRGRDLTMENLQPRVRAIYLLALSNELGHLVLAPGNKSELAVGYTTIYGDMVGGIAPIGDVLKTRLYDLARRLNRLEGRDLIPMSIMDKAPSAELRPGQKDTDSLPSYEVLDPIIAGFVEEGLDLEELTARGHDRETASRVVRLIMGSEYKRRQGPPVIKVTPAPFNSGYRLPIAQGWRPWG